MKFYQIAEKGQKPSGPLFESLAEARLEVRYIKQEDARSAREAMELGGVDSPVFEYEIVEVER